jgi:anti-sigma regulatory factor (Ser/Thr protein kinase)
MTEGLTIRDERDVALARRYVLEQCLQSGLLAVCDDAALLASELVTNAIRHAPGPGVRVRAARDDGHLVVQVTDSSRSQPTLAEPDPWAEDGRGMALVEAIAYEWGIAPHPSGKVVWFRI